MASCENKVDNEETVNIPISKEESVSLKLKSNDTRSIAKSQGSSKEFLNEKAQTIERKRGGVD
jgi:hypothetical protein